MIETFEPEFKKGDKVIMYDCLESGEYPYKVWTCRTDSFLEKYGEKKEVVFLDGYAGHFLSEFLDFANLGFTCSAQVEGRNSCEDQCLHCNQYFAPIEEDKVQPEQLRCWTGDEHLLGGDIVGTFFHKIEKNYIGENKFIEVQQFENSDCRMSCLIVDNTMVASVFERRNDLNNLEFTFWQSKKLANGNIV